MKTRIFGKSGRAVSEIGLGTWQLGTRWGDKSEETIGEYVSARPDHFYITTKCGRRLNPHTAEMYTPEAIAGFIDGSLSRMKLEKLDMILLHCPPTPETVRKLFFTKV